jgi:hypothetical protein
MANWQDLRTDDEVARWVKASWRRHRSGPFWADRIKELKDTPRKRLKLAIRNLPLPAAFREAAKALRQCIREKRKAGQVYDDELSLLYKLSAVESYHIDYAPRIQMPGYNVVERTPGGLLWSAPLDYQAVGYQDLRLLGKTDVRWLVEAWGEPQAHTSFNAVYSDLWTKYEDTLIAEERERQRLSWEELQR